MIEGHKLIQAHFANNERDTVELYWQYNDDVNQKTAVRVEYCKADESDEVYNWLLTQMSIDDLHEATALHIREQDSIYREAAMEIAKADGLIFDQRTGMVDTVKMFMNVLFDFDADKQKELLFQFKLAVFEMDVVKNLKDSTIKAKIRKANSVLEVVNEVSKLI